MSFKTSTLIGLAQLLNSEKYSDLKLVCQGQVFKVHKAIVCTRSPVFAAASNGNFQEAATDTIHINEFDAWTVKRMILFMYAEDYEDTSEFEPENAEVRTVNQDDEDSLPTLTPLLTLLPTTLPMAEIVLRHVKVNAIADYYDVPQLRQLANTKIQDILMTNWSAKNFPDVVNKVFSSTSDAALHQIITSTVAAHIEELIEHADFATVNLTSDFALDILRHVIGTYKAKEAFSTLKLQAAESRFQTAEFDASIERVRGDRESARADRVIKKIDGCLETLVNTNICRNPRCGADFTCYIERGGSRDEPNYGLRCARCRCKHKRS